MFLKLLLLSWIVITNAETQVNMLTENTCKLLDSWKQNGYIDTSAKYVVGGKQEIIQLSYNCKERFGTVMSNCRSYARVFAKPWLIFTGLAGPGGFCDEISLVWASPATTDLGWGKAAKRAQYSQAEKGCSCAPSGPSANPESPPTADHSTRSMSTSAPKSRDSSELRTAPSTSNSILASSTTLPRAHTSGSEAVCIIKLADLDSDPRGKCYCSDHTSRDWQPGVCEVCSWAMGGNTILKVDWREWLWELCVADDPPAD